MSTYWFVVLFTLLLCLAINGSCALYVALMLDDDKELSDITYLSLWRGHWLTVFMAGWQRTDKPGVRWVMRIWSVALATPVLIGLLISFS